MTQKQVLLWCCRLLLISVVVPQRSVLAQKPQPAVGAAAATAPKAPPDELIFTNGDRLTGKLMSASGGNVVFHSDMAGDLTIPFAKVKELHSGTEFVALKKGIPGRIRPEGTGAVAFAEGKVELRKETGPVMTLAPGDLGYLVDVPTYAKAVDKHASFREGWTGSATAGLTLVRSTETATTFTGAVNFVRAIPVVAYLPNRNRTTINVSETYGTNETPIIPQTAPPTPPSIVQTSIFHADGERDEYFSQRFFALADLSFDHNFSQGLQVQEVYGIGAGWTAIQNAKEELDLRADVHYEKQEFLPTAVGTVNTGNGEFQDNLDLVGSTFQENYRRTLPRKLVFTEWANILPAWNDEQAYTANAYMAFTMPLFKRMSATISATDNYLNNPSPGYRKNSVQFVTGLTYTIK